MNSSKFVPLLQICRELREKTSREIFRESLTALGILFDLDTACILEKNSHGRPSYTVVESFGRKKGLVQNACLQEAGGIVAQMLERKVPIFSDAALDLLRAGFPQEVATVYLFPLSGRRQSVDYILSIYDTRLIQEDVDTVFAFCEQVGLILENHELEEAILEQGRELAILRQVAQDVTRLSDLGELCQVIVERATEFLEAEQGSLLILDQDRQELIVRAVKGVHRAIGELFHVQVGEGVCGKVAETGVPLLVEDIESDERVRQAQRPRYKTKSFISHPIKLQDRVIGVLNVADKVGGEVFSQRDLEVMASISTCASIAIERSEFYRKTEKLAQLSVTDSLTGLYNRRFFEDRLGEEINRAQRYGFLVSLTMIDVDDFKVINDTYGHQEGDKTLRAISESIKRSVRTMDIAARYGGDEFMVLFPQTSKPTGTAITQRIFQEISGVTFPFLIRGQKWIPGFSAGVASFPDDARTAEDLVRSADVALYCAKIKGKGRIIAYEKNIITL